MALVGDGNLYANETGVPTVYFGPAHETAHSDHERVLVSTWHSAQVSTRWLLLNFVESQRNVESLVSLWDQPGERQKFDGAVMQNRLHLAG